jgi:hypothetical protein
LPDSPSKEKYDAAVELARGKLGLLSAGHGPGRVVFIRRIDQKPPWDASLLEACAASVQRAKTLHHPSLLAVIDAVPSPTGLLVVTEYVQGVPLRVLMTRAREQRKPMPLRAALRIADELARALAAAEDLLKQSDGRPLVGLHPECVIISSGDDALIADLGMITLERAPEHPEIVAYRAPELESGKGDARAVVYSLGLVLWETLAGRDAFGQSAPSATVAQIRKQAREGRVPRLDRIVRNVPPLLVELVTQSINVDPNARFPSVAAFGEALASVSEKRKPGELLKYMDELCADLITRQRAGLTLTNIAAASWRPTVHTFDAPQQPVIPKAPRLIGLAAFQQTPNEPGVESGNAVDSLLGHEEPVPSAPMITVEPMQVDMPPSAPLSTPGRPPQATSPLLLVNKPLPTPTPVATPQRTSSSTVNAAISYPDEYPQPRRRWGLVLFVLAVLGGAVALGAFAVKKQLEPVAADTSAPIVPTLGMSGLPSAGTGSLPWPTGASSARSQPATHGTRREGWVPRRTKDGGVDTTEPAPSAAPPATSGEATPSSDNPYGDPEPPPAASVDPKRGF